MLRTIRKTFAKVLLGNPLSRALLRRVALDEDVLVDLFSTARIRNRILSNDDVRDAFEQLIERSRLLGQRPTAPAKTSKMSPLADLKAPHSAPPITDLGPALQWGPRPFPLSNHGVCLLPESRLLVERWLRRLSSDAAVTLFVHPAMNHEASELAQHYRQIKKSVALPEASGAAPEDMQAAAAVIPVALDSPKPHLPLELVHALWRHGCRQYLMLSLAGAQQFEIPWTFEALSGRHNGERAIVLGDEANVGALDGAMLRDAILIADATTALALAQAGYCPAYWLCLDDEAIASRSLDIMAQLPAATVRVLPPAALPFIQGPNMCPLDLQALASDMSHTEPEAEHSGAIARARLALHLGCNPVCLVGVSAEEEQAHAGAFEALQERAAAVGGKILSLRNDDATGVIEQTAWNTVLSDSVALGG